MNVCGAGVFGAYAAKWLLARGRSEMGGCAILFGVSVVSLGAVLCLLRTGWEGVAAAVVMTVLLALSSAAMLGVNTLLLTYIPFYYGKIGRAAAVSGLLNGFSYAAAAAAAAVGLIDDWETVFAVFVTAAAVGALASLLGRRPLGRKLRELEKQ